MVVPYVCRYAFHSCQDLKTRGSAVAFFSKDLLASHTNRHIVRSNPRFKIGESCYYRLSALARRLVLTISFVPIKAEYDRLRLTNGLHISRLFLVTFVCGRRKISSIMVSPRPIIQPINRLFYNSSMS